MSDLIDQTTGEVIKYDPGKASDLFKLYRKGKLYEAAGKKIRDGIKGDLKQFIEDNGGHPIEQDGYSLGWVNAQVEGITPIDAFSAIGDTDLFIDLLKDSAFDMAKAKKLREQGNLDDDTWDSIQARTKPIRAMDQPRMEKIK